MAWTFVSPTNLDVDTLTAKVLYEEVGLWKVIRLGAAEKGTRTLGKSSENTCHPFCRWGHSKQ